MQSALLFLEYKNKILSLLFSENRLKKVEVHPKSRMDLGAIYVGKIKNVVPSIDACFVEYRQDKIGFLPLNQSKNAILLNRENKGNLAAGDEIIVQVETEEIKTKAPGLTCELSFRGKYVALMTGRQTLGFSSKLKNTNKTKLKDWLYESRIPEYLKKEAVGIVVRTNAGKLCQKELLLEEIEELLEEKRRVLSSGIHRTCFSCLYQPMNSYLAQIRDLYQWEFDKIVTDIPKVYEEIRQCFHDFPRIELYQDPKIPLSKLYSVQTQLKAALDEKVWLKSGAYLIIQPMEALTVIDVNSGKIQKKHWGDEVNFNINKEAAIEIAFQLKLRNISGIIVVDFINQNSQEQDRELLKFFSNLVKEDPIKTNVVDMTPLGLVEVTRKKVLKSLKEQLQGL